MFQFTCFPPLELFIHSRVISFYWYWVSPFGLSRFNWYLVYSTRIFADLHVLLRLLMPRHPPLALCSFTYFRIAFFTLNFVISNSILRLLAVLISNIDDYLRFSQKFLWITFVISWKTFLSGNRLTSAFSLSFTSCLLALNKLRSCSSQALHSLLTIRFALTLSSSFGSL